MSQPVPEIRSIAPAEAALALAALHELRPNSPATANALALKDYLEQVVGEHYRLVGSFEEGRADAVAVAGYRLMTMLAFGKMMYIDDLSTAPEMRGRGHANALLQWLDAEALRLGCTQIHLDSGVGEHRFTAHRQYLKHGMNITCHHFDKKLFDKKLDKKLVASEG